MPPHPGGHLHCPSRITVPVLTTCKDGEEAVEAWRAFSFVQGMIGSASMCGGVEYED